jgi:PAS domain S-box-containing protein
MTDMPTTSSGVTAILDTVPDAVIIINATGTILQFNRGAEAIFGYRDEEILGHTLDCLIPERFGQQHQEHLRHFVTAPENHLQMGRRYEVTGRRRDGTEFPLEAAVCKFTQEQQTGFAAVLRDITGRKQMESEIAQQQARLEQQLAERTAALAAANQQLEHALTRCVELSTALQQSQAELARRDANQFMVPNADASLPEHASPEQPADVATESSAEYFRLLAEYASDLVCLHTPDGHFLYLSPSCERLLGYHPDELVGMNAYNLFHPGDAEDIRTNSHEHVLTGKTINSVTYRIRKKSGEYIWFESFTQPILDCQGSLVQLVTASRDITDRRHAEMALRESEERYRAFVEYSPDMIMVSSQSGQILFINESGARMLGMEDPGQLVTRFVSDFFDLNRLPTNPQQTLTPAGDPAVTLLEHQIQRPDGHIRSLEVTSLPIQYQEAPAILSVGRDVTARRQAQDALHKSEQRFQAIFDQTFQHMGLLNPDGTVFKINHSALMFSGLQLADVVGRPIWETYFWNTSPDVREQTQAIIAEAATGTFAFLHYEAEIRGAGAQTAIIEFSIRPLKDATGTVLLLLLEGRDVTGRKRAEIQLRASQERYRAVVEQVAEGIFLLDTQTMRIIETNPTFQHLLGYTAEELQHLTIYDIIAEPVIEEINSNIGMAVHHGWHFIEDGQYVRKDRSLIDVEISASQITYDTTRMLCVVVRNITERKQAEARLRESEERYRQIAETAIEGIWLIDENSITTFVNQKMADMLGYTIEEMVGQPLTAFMNQTNLAAAEQNIERRKRGITEQHEFCFWRKDNLEEVWTLISTNPILDQEGRYQGALAMITDITERKRFETALEQERALLTQRVAERTAELSTVNAALARAVRLKDEFLANMSHELRTPLHAVLGQAEVLAEEIYGSLTVEQHKSVQMIEQSGRHLLSVINDILDLAKIEAGKVELDIQPVTLATCCQTSLQFIKQIAQKKNIKVSFSMDHTVEMIYADGRRLKQILVNLLSNAVKFTPDNGEIGLNVLANPEQEVVALTVWDTGIGIAPQKMDRLFQPFVQVDSGLARKHEGTGLGLYLVHRLIDMHGGNVSLESSEGQGSRFTITLPWRTYVPSTNLKEGEMPTPAPPTTPPLPRPQPITILLSEDNEASITLLFDYFTTVGYQVTVARNGIEAIERAREQRPDIILMDIQMPEMDGLEATRHIRADTALATVPIIALTALTMPGDRERCLEAGINEYLGKPVNLGRLVQVIEELLPPTASHEE